VLLAVVNMADLAGLWHVLADREVMSTSTTKQFRSDKLLAVGLGWAFADLCCSNLVSIVVN